MAQWLARRDRDWEVAGSSPTRNYVASQSCSLCLLSRV